MQEKKPPEYHANVFVPKMRLCLSLFTPAPRKFQKGNSELGIVSP
jgi:hypothetical protein